MKARAGSFQQWLVKTQLVPTFQRLSFLQRAVVLVVPPGPGAKNAELLILFSATHTLDLDLAFDALARNVQDPHLPTGVSNFSLYQPLDPGLRVGFCERASFLKLERNAELGTWDDLDAFALCCTVERDEHGVVACRHVDERLMTRLDAFGP